MWARDDMAHETPPSKCWKCESVMGVAGPVIEVPTMRHVNSPRYHGKLNSWAIYNITMKTGAVCGKTWLIEEATMDPQDSDCISPWCWGFEPGDRVRIGDGTFIGKEGVVLSHEAAEKRLREPGMPPFRPAREFIWVLVELFGRAVPIQFQPE